MQRRTIISAILAVTALFQLAVPAQSEEFGAQEMKRHIPVKPISCPYKKGFGRTLVQLKSPGFPNHLFSMMLKSKLL